MNPGVSNEGKRKYHNDATNPVEIDPQFLNDKDVQKLLKLTISQSKGSRHTFRDMWNDGTDSINIHDGALRYLDVFVFRNSHICRLSLSPDCINQ